MEYKTASVSAAGLKKTLLANTQAYLQGSITE